MADTNGWRKVSEQTGLVTGRVKSVLTSTNSLIYFSHFLSTWGDQMWWFGTGLFLIELSPNSLQLTASYGLSTGLSILLLGALIGDWVDKTARLKAAQLSLVLQNLFVALCALAVCVHLSYIDQITPIWHGGLKQVSFAVIIVFAILADLSSTARMIAIERDWIVEICGNDVDRLAEMTATMRRIDLAATILAPVVTGEIMFFTELRNGAIFMAAWNLGTVFLEYYLLWKVYDTVPALQKAKIRNKGVDNDDEKGYYAGKGTELVPLTDASLSKPTQNDTVVREGLFDTEPKQNGTLIREKLPEKEPNDTAIPGERNKKGQEKVEETSSCLRGAFSPFITLYTGWRTFMQYDVANAGLGLAMLYLTVLGFDNITNGYAYTQGVTEGALGLATATGAVVGIIGTFTYPVLRRRIGLERTGLFAMSSQIGCLMLCVSSVWAPGSPFEPRYYFERPALPNVSCTFKATINVNGNATAVTPEATSCGGSPPITTNVISVTLLMTGIVTARFGLWIADLTITQLFLEHVAENERGIVNGVQNSLNRLADMLKFALVVGFPQTEVFGYLVIISFICVLIGDVMYMTYSKRARGHLFPFHSLFCRKKEKDERLKAVS
ncbi:solute carrier family 40 protein member 1-like isoform X1 [Haliotis rufescens]|uniref:solute carrier family 40 protein member 1-like isoform X1 n=2 Tax=Haliotis rufescens TaxID=6454 RepID=UPI00201EBA46|nr:solute carrier family 40 protein member 1-like isoform X1 [Haliotis rufescens]